MNSWPFFTCHQSAPNPSPNGSHCIGMTEMQWFKLKVFLKRLSINLKNRLLSPLHDDFHFKNLLTIKSDPAIVGSEPSVHKFRLEKLLLFYNSML